MDLMFMVYYNLEHIAQLLYIAEFYMSSEDYCFQDEIYKIRQMSNYRVGPITHASLSLFVLLYYN